jgi:acyl transferase domain-containing protein
MTESQHPRQSQPIAIVGLGAIMPQAPTAAAFWDNITKGRYCITDVPKERWDPDLYYDPDPRAPDKTYSRIGGWVREFPWDPIGWHLPLPPKVIDQMDDGQKWAVSAARAALTDAGWPSWHVDPERVAVVIGNALGGEKHYESNLRIQLPEFTRELARSGAFAALPAAAREAIMAETTRSYLGNFAEITEDTMPGELANIISSRIAHLFNFRGPSFTTDAACASGLAGISAAAQGLADGHYDAVVTGGVDRNMGVAGFVKFCKIGALSATGTRPFDAGADGFVMGEGAALFVLKRLADAERDGDWIYAVLVGVGGASDGRGKGITAPNPAGQKLAIARAWRNAGADLATASCIEAHGTSTRVGDAVELESLTAVMPEGIEPGSIALGSVKSNIGHLKGAAGPAGLFKLVMSLNEKVLAPSLHFGRPNPNVDWAASPFGVNTGLREWPAPRGGVRRGGVSAFGFGGTNFHAVVEEYVPGRYRDGARRSFAGADVPAAGTGAAATPAGVPATPADAGGGPPPAAGTHRPAGIHHTPPAGHHVTPAGFAWPHNGRQGNGQAGNGQAGGGGGASAVAVLKEPLRGALVVGGATEAEVAATLARAAERAAAGEAPPPRPPDPSLASAGVRVAIDYAGAADLAGKAGSAVQALTGGPQALRTMLRARGVFIGHGPPGKAAFLYTGQGSQYVNMLARLRETEPIVARTFDEADEIMTPLLGRPLTSYIFIDASDPAAVATLERQLLQTEITQPAVLAADIALTRMLRAYGIYPDMVMGHSLGEYGALVAAGSLSFHAALEAVSARGQEMAHLKVADNGAMAAVMAPLEEIERVVASIDGYVVTANINSGHQAVIGGTTKAVEAAVAAFAAAGHTATRIPVSHAFHTSVVAPVSEPLRRTLERLKLSPPELPIVANVDGRFYPAEGPDVTGRMLDILARQVASPVQFVAGLRTLYDAGARVFVEVGPKRALASFAEDVLGGHDDVLTLFTNHPKTGDIASFNTALCGLYAAGLGYDVPRPEPHAAMAAAPSAPAPAATIAPVPAAASGTAPFPASGPAAAAHVLASTAPGASMSNDRYAELGRVVAELFHHGSQLLAGTGQFPGLMGHHPGALPGGAASDGGQTPGQAEPVVITGAALGLPGSGRVFDEENVARILAGEQFIDLVPRQARREMVDKHITRLVKSGTSTPVFETIETEADVIKLAGRYGTFDIVAEFGIDADRDAALDACTRLAIGVGLDALRDAGIPLVHHYHTTTLGTRLPGRWALPGELRDDTGVVFASAFPGYDSFSDELNRYHTDRARRHELAALADLRARMSADDPATAEADRRIGELRHLLDTQPFTFDRRFLFRALAMGHSQFAEYIGARGPNTQINAACASTAQALSLAQDWILAGRCRRVVIISADDAASDNLLPWTGSGFLASGAAATDDVVEDAALPFDRRRHGMIIGSGAAGLVVESAAAARERGISPAAEVLATATANSAFHGTRLDVEHIGEVMERLIRDAERRGIDRRQIAGETVFVSHETYTPARGGSASAEINALRKVFGSAAESIVIANTKGFTGHAMAAGVEEVVAVKALETGLVPPVPNFREVDPELGSLNLSRGGAYPVRYALRLAAGFGSQIAMTLLRWVVPPDGRRHAPSELGFGYRIADEGAWRGWLARIGGHDGVRLEVVQRKLRIADDAVPAAAPAAPAAAAMTAPEAVSATTAAAAPAPAAPTVSQPPTGEDLVAAAVLDIVEGLTGYPRDLLDLDLDLEADLGVDTVKQAEVFAAVRERFTIARDDNLKLRDFPTLSHVIGFVRDRATGPEPAQAPPAAPAAQATTTPAAATPAATTPADGSVPAPAPAPAPAATAPGAGQPADGDPAAAAVLDIVEGLTGYPRDLLDLDLDLEADLGVDTVKQAEVFAAVRERFAIARDDNLKLRDFPTLSHVIGFVRDRAACGTGGEEPAAQAASAGSAPQSAAAAAGPRIAATPAFSADMAAAERLARRTPVPVLRPPSGWCKRTGVTLAEGSRVIVMADQGGVAGSLVKRLESLGVTSLPLEPGCATDVLRAQLAGWLREGPVQGVYWLASLDAEPALSGLDLAGWREQLRRRVKNLHTLVHGLDAAGQLGAAGTFLVAATRLGGYHGYDEAGAAAPLGGAVTGFVKAYRRERPEVLAKAVDFPLSRKTAALAGALVEETLLDPGAVEIGRADDRRWTVGLREVAFGDGSGGLTLDASTVFVVTGAAGAIVSAIVADLAGASGGVFHLLDLAPAPDPADEDLARFATDRDGLKTVIAGRLAEGGNRPTPVLIERELAGYERQFSALIAIEAVRAAGGQAFYHRVDLTDPAAVAQVVADIRDRHGRIDVLLHAAGLEISRAVADKDEREFGLVFDVKSDGWFNLLHAAADLPIATTVAFSSVAGRFGNAGQTDYSAANDLLCKITSSFRTSRPGTRGIVIDWTAWGGLGMATRGSIPKVMAMAGVEMLDPAAGIGWIRRELTAGPFRGEVVVAGELGVLSAELDATGGLDPGAVPTAGRGPMTGTVTGMGIHTGLTVESRLDPAAQPFLDDHRIDATPVLPGVMGAEAFAEVAALAAPGTRVASIEQMDFLAPVKFYRDEPRTLTLSAVVSPAEGGLVADCALRASRVIKGEDAPRVTTHFTGRVRLSADGQAEAASQHDETPTKHAAVTASHDDIYRAFFHGPAYQVLQEAWRSDGCAVAKVAGALPAENTPQDVHTAYEPRLAEACFQTAGLWEIGLAGRFALPAHADRITLLHRPAAGEDLFVVAHPAKGGFDCAVVDTGGDVVVRVEGYQTAPVPGTLAGDVQRPIHDAMSG